jgi:hypothetical protein
MSWNKDTKQADGCRKLCPSKRSKEGILDEWRVCGLMCTNGEVNHSGSHTCDRHGDFR